jgi:hypothetical protein
VLTFAAAQGRAVLTLNRRHFRRLHRSSPTHPGILVCTHDSDSVRLAARIHEALAASPVLDNQLVRITRRQRG